MIRTVNGADGLSERLTPTSAFYQKVASFLTGRIPLTPSQGKYNLTISHERKFLWFRVAKVGTRTIFDLFERSGVRLDAEHALNCRYPEGLYRGYFAFAFVRNPWDRLVSCWLNKVVHSNHFGFSGERLAEMQEFRAFVDFVGEQNIESGDSHIRLQSRAIDLNRVDCVGRFERFEEDLREIMQNIGIRVADIGRKNRSKDSAAYRSYYDPELREKIAEIYRQDIRIFGYDF